MTETLNDCSTCEHMILVGAYHRPECDIKDYLPIIKRVGDSYIPVSINCRDYLPSEETE